MSARNVGYLILFIAPWILAQLMRAPAGESSFALVAATPTATEEAQPGISSPGPGDALQGVVAVVGTSDVPGFQRVEVAFAYQSDPTGTWFLLQQSSAQVKDGTLASWDTTTITDGTYRMRLRIFLQDGQVLERAVTGLRVRNYTAVETSTPAPEKRVTGEATLTPTSTPRADFQPSPVDATPLPTNPAQVTAQHLQTSALWGMLGVIGAALFGVLYLGVRSITRR